MFVVVFNGFNQQVISVNYLFGIGDFKTSQLIGAALTAGVVIGVLLTLSLKKLRTRRSAM